MYPFDLKLVSSNIRRAVLAWTVMGALSMARRFIAIVAILLAIATFSYGVENESSEWSSEIRPFLQQFCSDCHSGSGAEADIDFDSYETDEALPTQRARWNQIRGMIRIGAMPPSDYEPQPSHEMRQRVADWIHQKINTVDCEVTQDPGRVTMRRLNSVEYDNSIRDLLEIDFSPSELIGFPSDDVGDGFDNQGDVLSVSELQLEKYIQAAALIAEKVLVSPDSLSRQSKEMPSLYLGDHQAVPFQFAEGSYEIKPRLQFSQASDQPAEVVITVGGEPIETLEVTNRRKTYRIERQMSAGHHEVALHFQTDPGEEKKGRNRRIDVESISIQGPPVVTESYSRLMGQLGELSSEADIQETMDAVRQQLLPLVRRAFRRQPSPSDVERVVQVVRMALEQEMPIEQAMGLGLQAILISPHFLFRVEQEGEPETNLDSELLDQYALASRLSYFLWSSLPDEELLDLAEAESLSKTEVLNEQISRMLDDPKSEALVQRFFGQYLGLGNLRDVSPDPNQFPEWNDRLKAALQRETELFCRELIDGDLPIDMLLNGDFTYINPRLAELYSVDFDGHDPKELYELGPGFFAGGKKQRNKEYLDEHRWIRIPVPPNRRGVLTHASVLTLTSNPTTTSPVKRGKWIMETILGDPPPPAPPNVPALEETQEEHENLTLREQLELHRANPSCASCHDVMDPLGLGFEHFDAIGRWRETDAGSPVDAGGQLVDGRKFNGSVELIELLQEKQPQIYRFFTEKLLTYALGRSLEPYDQCAIDSIMEKAEEKKFTVRSLVQLVVQSEPFLKRRMAAASEVAMGP